MYPSYQVCYTCDERIRFNPFTRTVGDECFLYCSNDCMHKHFTKSVLADYNQQRFAFDVT